MIFNQIKYIAHPGSLIAIFLVYMLRKLSSILWMNLKIAQSILSFETNN